MTTYLEFFRDALHLKIASLPSSVYLGEDVSSGFCGLSLGLSSLINSKRIVDMPISESCFTSMGLGLALSGNAVFIEYNFSGLVYLTFDQIYNQIFKYTEMTGYPLPAPIVLLLPTGTKGYRSVHHSDNTYTSLVPLGINCYMPVYKQHIANTLDTVCSNNELHVIFLPMQEFPITREDCLSLECNSNLAFSRKDIKSSICILASGTALDESLRASDKFSALYSIPVDVITFYRLNELEQSSHCLTQLGYQSVIMADDSIASYGLFSKLIAKQDLLCNTIEICRTNNTIPFNNELEYSRRSSCDRIFNALVSIVSA